MTIPNTARKAGPLLGTGSQTAWPFTFKVFAAGDVQVTIANSSGTETPLVLGTDYTVTLNSNQETSPGGTVNYPISGAALPVGSVLAIIGDLDYDQPLDLPSGGNFSPTALENQLDRATMQIQQLREEMNRTAKLPPTSTESVEALVDDLQRIADSADNLDTVADNIADINTVASDLNEPVSEINTVAGAIANVNAVGSNITNVNTVAGISANVTTVAGIAANVTAVAAIDDDVTAVAGVAAAVTAVAAIDDDVTIAAANVADITNFADVYQGAKTSDPALRNDGSALQAGDLYFNTTNEEMRVYGGTLWKSGFVGTVAVQNFSGNGSTTAFTLTTAPGGENNTQIFIGGVYQQKDQYSVSGTTLTFNTAPTTGTNNIEVVTISTLALGETDASLVSFVQAGTGAVERTAQNKMREVLSVEDFGAIGSDVTTDQAAIDLAIAANKSPVLLPAGDYFVSTLSNLNGIEFEGPGRLLKAITGGYQQLNSYGDKNQWVTGREYLSAFHKALIAGSTAKIVFSGDSTTEGVGVSADYAIDTLILDFAQRNGLTKVTTVNAGHGGKTSYDWVSSYLASDLASNPTLYVVRWGINDAISYTADQFLAKMRAGLAVCRASKSLAQMSIILQMPNSVSDTPNNRDERWFEAIARGLKQIAREYQCCFVDTYAYLRDSRNAADWMDDPYGDGRHVHPADVMNLWVVDLLEHVIFPKSLCKVAETFATVVPKTATKVATDAASTYPLGLSYYRATTGFKYDGFVATFNHPLNFQLQINYSYLGGINSDTVAMRLGLAGVWQEWFVVGGGAGYNVTPAAGFTQPGGAENMQTANSGQICIGKGYLLGSGTTVASGTTIGTVNTRHAPTAQVWWCNLIIWNGSTFERIRGQVSVGGVITTQQASTINCTRVWLDHTWYK